MVGQLTSERASGASGSRQRAWDSVSSSADPAEPETPAEPGAPATPAAPPPLILAPLTGPPIPDMAPAIEESRRRHEVELATAQRLVAQARAGAGPIAPPRPGEPTSPPAPGQFRIEIDWRGETAHVVEHDRRVRLECFYWGGPAGGVSHIDGVWEYADGRREPLTPDERAVVLRRVVDHARTREDIALRIDRA